MPVLVSAQRLLQSQVVWFSNTDIPALLSSRGERYVSMRGPETAGGAHERPADSLDLSGWRSQTAGISQSRLRRANSRVRVQTCRKLAALDLQLPQTWRMILLCFIRASPHRQRQNLYPPESRAREPFHWFKFTRGGSG